MTFYDVIKKVATVKHPCRWAWETIYELTLYGLISLNLLSPHPLINSSYPTTSACMQVLSIYKHTLSFDPFKQQNHKNVCNKTTHPHGPKAPAGWPIHVEGSVSNPPSVNYCDKLITFCITGALKKRILHAHFLYTFNDYNNADHKVVHVMHCTQKKVFAYTYIN